ncbi:MAG TPA: hypothetical protein VKZ63_20635 [Kofleriaceae bacterium]|nr:hypothetical protein [Kofleriaceae bacterium]
MRRRDPQRGAVDLEPVPGGGRELEQAGEPPVVARLVVEVRSDGRRTIARGAIEDAASGEGAAIEARGDSPVQLAFSLARAMFSLPALRRGAARALIGAGRPARRRRQGPR